MFSVLSHSIFVTICYTVKLSDINTMCCLLGSVLTWEALLALPKSSFWILDWVSYYWLPLHCNKRVSILLHYPL